MPRWLIPAGLLLTAGLAVILPSTAQTKSRARKPMLSSGPLTAEALRKVGYDDAIIKRILAVQPYVEQATRYFNVDPALVNGIIYAESRFHAKALSPVGARGMMQLMPKTEAGWAQDTGRVGGDVFDPAYNIWLGTYGIGRLMRKWNQDPVRALASYNWGIGNVQEHPDGPFPAETTKYIQRVIQHQKRFNRAARLS